MAVALVAMFVGLVWAPAASAASDPLASGSTTLTLNRGLVKKLKRNGVRILKVGSATVRGRKATFPVTGGSLDPTTGAGTVNHSGGIKFKRGKRNVALKNFVVDTTTASLSGRVGKRSQKIASTKGVTFTRNGFGVDVKVSNLKLTGKTAKALNKKLGLKGKKRIKAKSLGASASTTQPSTVTVLPVGNASLSPDPATLAKFASKGVNPLTDIRPINGAGVGPLNTSGGLSIQPAGKLKTEFNNLSADFGTKVITAEVNITPSPPGPGNLGRTSIADIDLTGATVSSDPAARTVSVTDMTVKLQAVAAATLNEVYPGGVDFVAGDSLGTVSFTAQTQ
jgi:hypothetical protein